MFRLTGKYGYYSGPCGSIYRNQVSRLSENSEDMHCMDDDLEEGRDVNGASPRGKRCVPAPWAFSASFNFIVHRSTPAELRSPSLHDATPNGLRVPSFTNPTPAQHHTRLAPAALSDRWVNLRSSRNGLELGRAGRTGMGKNRRAVGNKRPAIGGIAETSSEKSASVGVSATEGNLARTQFEN